MPGIEPSPVKCWLALPLTLKVSEALGASGEKTCMAGGSRPLDEASGALSGSSAIDFLPYKPPCGMLWAIAPIERGTVGAGLAARNDFLDHHASLARIRSFWTPCGLHPENPPSRAITVAAKCTHPPRE